MHSVQGQGLRQAKIDAGMGSVAPQQAWTKDLKEAKNTFYRNVHVSMAVTSAAGSLKIAVYGALLKL
ncbi:MAG: hypothetical protein WCE82_06580 [Halobacteriota archaeon]